MKTTKLFLLLGLGVSIIGLIAGGFRIYQIQESERQLTTAQDKCSVEIAEYSLGRKSNRDIYQRGEFEVSVAYIGFPLGGVVISRTKTSQDKNMFIQEFGINGEFKETQLEFIKESTRQIIGSAAGFRPQRVLICTDAK